MKAFRWIGILLVSFSLLSCAQGGKVPLNIQYQPVKQFPDLQQKIGSTLAVTPVKDVRQDPSYLGMHTPLAGNMEYYKSAAFPLDEVIMGSLSRILPPYGVKLVPIPRWDGNPESLKEIDADSVMTIEIRKFWAESKSEVWGSEVNISVQFLIYLGVKKENKVFTRNFQVDKSDTTLRVTPEWMEGAINPILTQIFDSFFSNPY
jgi:hypothetical protein